MKRDKEDKRALIEEERGERGCAMVDKIGGERDLIAGAGRDKDLVRAKTAAIIKAEKQNIEIRDIGCTTE